MLTTTIHHYRFDTSKPEEAAAYAKLRDDTLNRIGFPCWTMRGDFDHRPVYDFLRRVERANGAMVEIETDHLFDNQWNLRDPNIRAFNWSEAIYPNKYIREGYWLEQTDAMRAVLRDTLKCGFCGKHEPRLPSTPVFCPHCIDSEYLGADELHLTRLVPVCDTSKPRAPLTDNERDILLPVYRAAQKAGATARGRARLAKERESIEREYEDAVSTATVKRDARRWIMDNCPQLLDEHIYYSHTDRHCFGWRNPLSSDHVSQLLDVISEFPYAYEIKCADGRKLERY